MSLKAVSCLVVALLASSALAELDASPPTPETSASDTTEHATRPEPTLQVAPVSRGQMLYENHCTGCHESVVFVREQRSVGDLQQLRAMVRRWVQELEAPWGAEEIDDVVRYLNTRHYHFSS